jgi:hypothetical protein
MWVPPRMCMCVSVEYIGGRLCITVPRWMVYTSITTGRSAGRWRGGMSNRATPELSLVVHECPTEFPCPRHDVTRF